MCSDDIFDGRVLMLPISMLHAEFALVACKLLSNWCLLRYWYFSPTGKMPTATRTHKWLRLVHYCYTFSHTILKKERENTQPRYTVTDALRWKFFIKRRFFRIVFKLILLLFLCHCCIFLYFLLIHYIFFLYIRSTGWLEFFQPECSSRFEGLLRLRWGVIIGVRRCAEVTTVRLGAVPVTSK